MNKKVTNTPKRLPIATMTVGDFERAQKTILRETNKSMQLPKYFEKIGFPEFAKLITD